MGRRKRKVILLTIAGILGAAAVILLLVRMTAPSKEFTATQAIIENLPEYSCAGSSDVAVSPAASCGSAAVSWGCPPASTSAAVETL